MLNVQEGYMKLIKSNTTKGELYSAYREVYDSNLSKNLKFMGTSSVSKLKESNFLETLEDFLDMDITALKRMREFVIANGIELETDQKHLLYEHLVEYTGYLDSFINLKYSSVEETDFDTSSDAVSNLHATLRASDTAMRYVITNSWNYGFYLNSFSEL